jgi:precorrin-6B methylase 2
MDRPATNYALGAGDDEVRRLGWLAEEAEEAERRLWTIAGITAGAVVGDIGCGPAAMSIRIGRAVGPTGRVIAVDQEPAALEAARKALADAGITNVELRRGEATSTGVEPGSLDVAVLRHVLGHNGGREAEIVRHLATLVRPGGCVYLVDVDATAARVLDDDPALESMRERYRELHRQLGNDFAVGLRLRKLLAGAGLEVIRYEGRYQISSVPPGGRPPPWAARDRMLATGLATADEVAAWQVALERLDHQADRPTLFLPIFVGIGRRP